MQSKRTHKNQQQYEIFLKFMTSNPSIAKGFVKGDRVAYDGKWAVLAANLNAVGPPTKDMQGWKKVWSDCKLAIKKKLAHNKETTATGGSPYMQLSLTPAERSIATLCGFYQAVEEMQSTKTYVIRPSNVKQFLEMEMDTNPEPFQIPADVEEPSIEKSPKRTRRAKPENLEDICGAQNALMQNVVDSLEAIRSNAEKQTSLMAQHYKNIEEIEAKKLEALQRLLKQ